MKYILAKLLSRLEKILFVIKFVVNNAGSQYGICHSKKLELALKIIRNNKKVVSLTNWVQHFLLVQEIFKIPESLKGDVVECGCYNGATTINLSLACALTHRRLIVCDSFEGLPEPEDNERYEINPDATDYYVWEKGEFSSVDGLEGVKNNVEKFGNIKTCQFVKGYFENSLKNIDTDSIVLIFEDADMPSSVQDCLRYLWPKLQEGCKFFCHEPWSINVVSLFYDRKWWKDNLNTHPPGFYGSGHGIISGLGLIYSEIGYAKKFDANKIKERGKKKLHIGSKGFQG